MTGEEYFAMKWFEKQEAKKPSNRLHRANEMWRQGCRLADVNRDTDLWTRIPQQLAYARATDTIIVKGKEYRIVRFDFYDNVIVEDKNGKQAYHNIYGSRGDLFFQKAKIKG